MKRLILPCTLAATFSCLTAPAFAACPNLDQLLANAYPNATTSGSGLEVDGPYRQRIDPLTVACKTWPAQPDITLMAIPRTELSPPDDDQRRGDIEVIAVDSKTGIPLARRIEKGAAFSDAVEFGGVTLDTARYETGDDRRAFAIRTRHFNRSGIFPFSDEVLWLYRLNKGDLDLLLEGLTTASSRGDIDSNCQSSSEETKRTISTGKQRAGHLPDLVIGQMVTTETTKQGNDDCVVASKTVRRTKFVLHDGDPHYGAPADKGVFKDVSYNELFSPASEE